MYIQRQDTIPLNGVNDNVLAGNQFEFAPVSSIVEFGLDGAAIGLEIDVLIGARSIVTRMNPPIDNRFAKYPDEFTLRAAAMQGERVIVRARNTTGANIILFTTVKYNPV